MTTFQKDALRALITYLRPDEFHHGDCTGADEESHGIVLEASKTCRIVIHPPSDPAKRAFVTLPASRVEVLTPKPYLPRNRDIVLACSVIIAAPRQNNDVRRSGTWSTYRLAAKLGRRIALLLPG